MLVLKNLHTRNSLIAAITKNAADADEANAFNEAAFEAIASAGLLAITLPCRELDFNKPVAFQLLQLLKIIGYADLAVGRIYEGHINALHLIHLFASAEQKNILFEDAAQQKLFGVWNTQPANGVKIFRKDDKRYVLEGNKTFCSGGSYIKRALVTGDLIDGDNKGWQMCLIPVEKVKAITEDAVGWKPIGMKSSISYQMNFDGIELEEDDLIGNPGDYYRQPYFGSGAMRFAAVQLGGAEALFDAAKQFLKEHQREKDTFQQARAGEVACLLESGNNWLKNAATKLNNQDKDSLPEQEKTVVYANMMRTAIEEICIRTMTLLVKSVGAKALMPPYYFERLHRNLTFYLRQPAPDAALQHIGKYVFTQDGIADDLWGW